MSSVPTPSSENDLSLRSVSFSHTQGRPVLEGFSAVFRAGQVSALVGRNGSGKTTLLKIIISAVAHLDTRYALHSGEVLHNGFDRTNTGFVPQDFADSLLPWYTVRDNLTLPLIWRGREVPSSPQNVLAQLASFGMPADRIHSLAPRYAHTLSVGEKQLVCVARAVLLAPRLLVLDEPFSSLDVATAHTCEQALLRYQELHRPLVILACHDLHQAAYLATHVLVIGTGRTQGELQMPAKAGPRAAVMAQPEFMNAVEAIRRCLDCE